MPDLNTLLSIATDLNSEISPAKKKFSRGIRPDHIARGEGLSEKFEQKTHETSNKPATNRQQTDNKVTTEEATNRQQTDNKVATKTDHKNETGNKPSTQPATEAEAKRQQTDNKLATKCHFSSLVGLQREIIIFIYSQCKVSRSKSTGPISLGFLTSIIKTTENSAKVTIQRLEKKSILSRVESKNGRGGWARFELTENIYRELLQLETDNKLETKWQQTDNKLSTQPATEPTTSAPIVVVSSNSLNTTNTEAGEEPCFVIPIELTGKVSRRQLSEFVTSGKITESDLQLSLDAFAYDLRNKLVSLKHSSNPVGLLIGAIKNNGSYNSAKYIEVLKSELKPFIQEQRETTEEKTKQKESKEWEEFQKFKTETPEDYKTLESKVSSFGFKGPLLEEFVFLEFKKVILKTENEELINPLRPPVSANP